MEQKQIEKLLEVGLLQEEGTPFIKRNITIFRMDNED